SAAESSANKIRQRYVTVTVTNLPQSREHQHHIWIEQNAVWNGEKSRRTGAIQCCGNGDDRIGRVKIAANQEPCHERSKATSGQAPFLQAVQIAASPARSPEACQCHYQEAGTEYSSGNCM